MRKLSKIELNDFQEMSDVEMKHIVGGSGSEEDGSGTGTCGVKMWCGEKSSLIEYGYSMDEAISLLGQYANSSGGSCENILIVGDSGVVTGNSITPRYTYCCDSC